MKLGTNLLTKIAIFTTFAGASLAASLGGCTDYTTVEPHTETTTTTTQTPAPQDNNDTQPAELWEQTVTLQDGREVTCLYLTNDVLSCDWEGATTPAPEEPPLDDTTTEEPVMENATMEEPMLDDTTQEDPAPEEPTQ